MPSAPHAPAPEQALRASTAADSKACVLTQRAEKAVQAQVFRGHGCMSSCNKLASPECMLLFCFLELVLICQNAGILHDSQR